MPRRHTVLREEAASLLMLLGQEPELATAHPLPAAAWFFLGAYTCRQGARGSAAGIMETATTAVGPASARAGWRAVVAEGLVEPDGTDWRLSERGQIWVARFGWQLECAVRRHRAQTDSLPRRSTR